MILRRAVLCRAHDLECELRHAVAELAQRKVFEHDIGRAAIGGRIGGPLDRRDLGIRRLVLRPCIDPHIKREGRHLFAVRPDTANARDLSLAQRHCKADGIAIGRRGRLRPRALTAPCGFGAFGKAAGPDHMTAQPHPPVQTRNRAALAGAGQTKAVHAANLDRFAACT